MNDDIFYSVNDLLSNEYYSGAAMQMRYVNKIGIHRKESKYVRYCQ
jgi:hypothetical protein